MFNVLQRSKIQKPFEGKRLISTWSQSGLLSQLDLQHQRWVILEKSEAYLFSSYHNTDQRRPPLVNVCLPDEILGSSLFQHWLCISLEPHTPMLYLIKTTKCIWLELHPPWQASHGPQAVLGCSRCRDQSYSKILGLEDLACLCVHVYAFSMFLEQAACLFGPTVIAWSEPKHTFFSESFFSPGFSLNQLDFTPLFHKMKTLRLVFSSRHSLVITAGRSCTTLTSKWTGKRSSNSDFLSG